MFPFQKCQSTEMIVHKDVLFPPFPCMDEKFGKDSQVV